LAGQLLGKGVDVENYPGVVGDGATGTGVVALMRSQAASFATRMLDDLLVDVDLSQRPFVLTLNGNRLDGRPNQPYTIKASYRPFHFHGRFTSRSFLFSVLGGVLLEICSELKPFVSCPCFSYPPRKIALRFAEASGPAG
jgi:hypothetical protein